MILTQLAGVMAVLLTSRALHLHTGLNDHFGTPGFRGRGNITEMLDVLLQLKRLLFSRLSVVFFPWQ